MYSIYTFLLLNKANKAYCYRASCAKLDNFDEEPKLTNGGLYGAEIHATDYACAQTKTARDSRRSPTRSGSPAFCTRFRKETGRTHSVAMRFFFFLSARVLSTAHLPFIVSTAHVLKVLQEFLRRISASLSLSTELYRALRQL